MSGECCLGFVFFGHLDLIITQESIHNGEEHIRSGIIDQCIDMLPWGWPGSNICNQCTCVLSHLS